MKTISEVRESFWDNHPEFEKHYSRNKRQNQYNADIRMAFIDWIEYLVRSGQISDKLANRVTL